MMAANFQTWWQLRRHALVILLACLPIATEAQDWSREPDADSMIVVAIAEQPDPSIAAGATPRGYDDLADYNGSDRSIGAARKLQADYELAEVAAWTIEALKLRCMVYRPRDGVAREPLLQRLRDDPRVRIAQPLQEFQVLAQPASAGINAGDRQLPTYNDPYHRLQQNFTTLQADVAQRWSQGRGSRIALIDTAVDAQHPDLAGRIVEQRDFVATATGQPVTTMAVDQRHGTEVAGVIAAIANNGIGIVGIAPAARIQAYRACWATAAAPAARCNSFTLALALAAAISTEARIIHLSLGGPTDPLLHQLLQKAVLDGAIVVAAVPPDGNRNGFPLDVAGVIAVAGDDPPSGDVLRAPSSNILALQPGGHYDYSSGSSLAAAEASAIIALMLEHQPSLTAAAAQSALRDSSPTALGAINACVAIAGLLGRATALCASRTPAAPH